MSAAIEKNLFKAANNYDIYDPESNELIMNCREKSLSFITKWLRFTDYKRMTPFNVTIETPDGKPIVRVSRGISIFLSKVKVYDEKDRHIGGFNQKFFSISGKFSVVDKNDKVICSLKGKWRGWDFRFFSNSDEELAHVSKKWAGIGKELFTSADNYILELSKSLPSKSPLRKLILSAVICIDMVLKE
jgi:uncharacterized protein YxjI